VVLAEDGAEVELDLLFAAGDRAFLGEGRRGEDGGDECDGHALGFHGFLSVRVCTVGHMSVEDEYGTADGEPLLVDRSALPVDRWALTSSNRISAGQRLAMENRPAAGAMSSRSPATLDP